MADSAVERVAIEAMAKAVAMELHGGYPAYREARDKWPCWPRCVKIATAVHDAYLSHVQATMNEIVMDGEGVVIERDKGN